MVYMGLPFLPMIKVKATREGLMGAVTASGYVIDTKVPYVALPAEDALYRFIRIRNPLNSHVAMAVVLDVGPHFTNDTKYVFGEQRPLAESRNTNGAGIDLGERVWKTLDMKDNTEVEWEFIE